MSTSPLSLHAAPAVGFEAPFEMLAACHERVERMLALLLRLAGHLATHGADVQAAGAARDVMRYFDVAGPHHHEDEERHVLPRLAALGRGDLAERLHADHARMTAEWAAIRPVLAGVAERRWDAAQAPAHVGRWEAFAALYRAHIVAEEQEAYPPVAAAAAPDELHTMGDEMAARRGAPPRG